MPDKTRRRMKLIHSWDEVPRFSSEAEEREFWDTHGLGDELLAQFKPVAPDDPELPPARTERRRLRTSQAGDRGP